MRRTISSISPRFSLRLVGLLCLSATMTLAMACAGDSPTAPSATAGVPVGSGLTPTSVSDDKTESPTLDAMKKVTTSCPPDAPVISRVRPNPLNTNKSGGRLTITGANFQDFQVTTDGPLALGGIATVNKKGTEIRQNYQVTDPTVTGSFNVTVTTACDPPASFSVDIVSKGNPKLPSAPVLDQSFRPVGSNTTGFGPSGDRAQTFTVGIAGTLTRVDVFLSYERDTVGSPLPYDIFADIRPTTAGGLPAADGTELASAIIPGSAVTADMNVDPFVYTRVSFLVNVPVAVGDVLAVVLRSDDVPEPPYYNWQEQDNQPSPLYDRGQKCSRNSAPFGDGVTWVCPLTDGDVAFETFVVPN